MGAVRFVTRRRLARRWRRAGRARASLLGTRCSACALASFAAARRTASAYDRIARRPPARPTPRWPSGRRREAHPPARRRSRASPVNACTRDSWAPRGGVDPVAHDRAASRRSATGASRSSSRTSGRSAAGSRRARRGDREHRAPRPGATCTSVNDCSSSCSTRCRPRRRAPTWRSSASARIPRRSSPTRPGCWASSCSRTAFYDAHRDFAGVRGEQRRARTGCRRAGATSRPSSGSSASSCSPLAPRSATTVSDALRPLVIVLIAIGALAFGAGDGGRRAGRRAHPRPVAVRRRPDADARSRADPGPGGRARDRGRRDRRRPRARDRHDGAGALPLAPIGPLHDHDPGQGFVVDGLVLGVGALAVVDHRRTAHDSRCRRSGSTALRPSVRRSPWFTALPASPATAAGITLALRTDDGRRPGVARGGRDDAGRRRRRVPRPRSWSSAVDADRHAVELRLRRRRRRAQRLRQPDRGGAPRTHSDDATTCGRRLRTPRARS